VLIGWEARLTDIDPFNVHIDLMVVMLAPKLAAVYLKSTDPDVSMITPVEVGCIVCARPCGGIPDNGIRFHPL